MADSKPIDGDAARLLKALGDNTEGAGHAQFTPGPSAARRAVLGLGYGALIATNVASGFGVFGPDNATVSNAYPTAITPSGYAFAIWGIIFMLEGAGVVYLICPAGTGSVRAITFDAIWSRWVAMWTMQNLWQLVFARTPLVPNPSYISLGRVFLPCSVLLLSAWGAGLISCRSLQAQLVRSHAAGLLVALPSGINTGWLSGASCIGVALVGQCVAGSPEALNATGVPLILASTATAGGLLALQQWGAGYTGLGYAGAVAWALRAVAINTANPVSTPEVRSTALVGACLIGAGAAASVLWRLWKSARPSTPAHQ